MTTESPSKAASTDTSGMPLPNLKDACYVNAMIHFYRGELGRIMIWRQRLDVTTTWAITSTTSSRLHVNATRAASAAACLLMLFSAS